MNRMAFELSKVDWRSAPHVIGVSLLLGFSVYGLSIFFQKDEPVEAIEVVGIHPNATRLHLRELSSVLVTADKKGDARLAEVVRLQAIAAKVAIDRQPGAKDLSSPMHSCALAALHLAGAAYHVENGGRWTNEDQFQSAASDCRI